MNKSFDILIRQCDKLKYGSDDFVNSESFVEHFYQQIDKDYLNLVDTNETLIRLGFKVTDVKE